jgi:hypothetical protein
MEGRKYSTFGPSLQGSRGDPVRRLTAWVPPCSRSLQAGRPRIAPRFPRPSPAEGPRRFRQCRSGPADAAQESKTGGCGRARGAWPGPGGTWVAGPRSWGRGGSDPAAEANGWRQAGRPAARRRISRPLVSFRIMSVKSPRTAGLPGDRTRWPKRRCCLKLG